MLDTKRRQAYGRLDRDKYVRASRLFDNDTDL